MAENSGIEWTTHTFNPWIGCTKISPACDNCYAEVWDEKAGGGRWGPRALRTRTKSGWGRPLKWDKDAAASGVRARVFSASLADIFDNHYSIEQKWRDDFWALIRKTPNLDWLLLTKRPQNIAKYLPSDWGPNGYDNVWLGMSAENQEQYDRLKRHLVAVPAKVHYLSMEPLLEDVNLGDASGIEWIIAGGESGEGYREADINWFRSIRDQCERLEIPFIFKQWSGLSQTDIKHKGRELDGVIHDGYPAAA